MLIFIKKPKDEMIIHTDLGSQYTNQEFKKLTLDFSIFHSFSLKDCPYGNAYIEAFHTALKKEEIYKKQTI